ncbi:sugar transferase [Hydrotalea sp.]|uniref:sugar transferase n=1 Tax=Hydrotalea sp. TaxID=2881279 RepID=UPI003D0DAC29
MLQTFLKRRETAVIALDNDIVERLNSIAHKAEIVKTSITKRLFDIFFTTLLFVFVFSWLFPIIMLLIKLSSKGPVFFRQDRIGLNGIVFKCYKFRTMAANIKCDVYTPTQVEDSRITSVGKFLRKFNLDELPQAINVFLGDMSLVGPRPHAIPFHNEYATYVDYIDLRHLIKPGITGLAQINGYRGDVLDREENKKRTAKRIAYDLEYIQNWSFGLDIKIIGTTVAQMISNKTNGH